MVSSSLVRPESNPRRLRPRRFAWCAAAVAGVLISACGDDESLGSDDVPIGEVSTPLTAIHSIGSGSTEVAEQTLTVALDGWILATQQTGVPTSTGSIRETEPGVFVYQPSPPDSLEVSVLDSAGDRVDVSAVFDGSSSWLGGATGGQILGGNHEITATLRSSGIDAVVRSVRTGADVESRIDGQVVNHGTTFDVSLVRVGQSRFENDSTGASAQTNVITTGSARGPGIECDVRDQFDFEFVQSERGSANTSSNRLSHTLRVEGATYVFESVLVRRNFRNGVPNDFPFWRAEGAVTRDGAPFASYELEEEVIDAVRGQGFFVVNLRTPSELLEIERWQRIP
ncbi:MAG: hypothetical protein AAGA56_10135 [Myxococcota bacterium]